MRLEENDDEDAVDQLKTKVQEVWEQNRVAAESLSEQAVQTEITYGESMRLRAVSTVMVMMEASAKVMATAVVLGISALLIMVVNSHKVRIDDEPPIVTEQPASSSQDPAIATYDNIGDEEEEEEAKHPLVYLAFGRVKDHTILASWHPETEQEMRITCQQTFTKLLKAAKTKLKAGDKNKLKAQSFEVYFFLDSDREYMTAVSIIEDTYEDKHAYSCVSELMKSARKMRSLEKAKDGGCTDSLSGTLIELFAKWKCPAEHSTYGKALSKINTVKNTMTQNEVQVQSNMSGLHELEQSSHTMDAFAERFKDHSEVAVEKHQWERTKLNIFYGTFAFDVVSIIVIWVLL